MRVKNSPWLSRVLVVWCAAALAGCGGGGGGATDPQGPPVGNTPPTIQGQPPSEVKQDRAYDFTPVASDAERDALTFTIDNKPAWAQFDAQSGRLSGTPGSADVGTQAGIVISVKDATASTSLPAFSITVIDVNDPPTIDPISPQTAAAGAAFSYQVVAQDPEGSALTYSLTRAPAGMSISPAGLIAWKSDTPSAAPIAVEVAVTDSAQPPLSSRSSFEITVVRVAPPDGSVVRPQLGAITVNAGEWVQFAATGIDPEGNTPLSYAWHFGDPTISDALGDTPAPVRFSTPGTHRVTLTATNKLGLADPTPAEVSVTVVKSAIASLNKANWSLKFVDSEETDPVEDGRGQRAFDGNTATFWHTQWVKADPPGPHEIQIDLGGTYDLDGFQTLPRQDSNATGEIADYAFYVSRDGKAWGAAAAGGVFSRDKGRKEVRFAATLTARYVRLAALSEINGGPWASLAELDVLGRAFSGNVPPEATIAQPAADLVVAVGESVTFAGSGLDPDSASGDTLLYRWSFGNSGIADSVGAKPAPVRFDRAGTYVVSLIVADAMGRVSAPAKRVIKVTNSPNASIDPAAWRLYYVDSEQQAVPSAGVASAVAANAFDGDAATYWRSLGYPTGTPMPHEIQIDLGQLYDLDAFRYLPRQDGVRAGRIGDYDFYVSEDGKGWGAAVASGRFADDATEKRVLFAPKRGQFVRLVARSEVTGASATDTAVAELGIEGTPAVCAQPATRLLEPLSRAVQPDKLIVRASACVAPGMRIKVLVDGQDKATLAAAPWSTVITGLSRSNHTVALQLLDSAGNVVRDNGGKPVGDTVDQVGIGDYYVALGDSITNGFADTDASDNVSADGRNSSAGYTPILNDKLTQALGYPHTVVNEGINGATSADGLGKIRTLFARHPRANVLLVGFGTNDAAKLPLTGKGTGPGKPGYDGSFKAYMQAIYDAATAGGLRVYFQKIPYPSVEDQKIIDSNIVIDELVAANHITVVPPDLYDHFKQNFISGGGDEYADRLHPNGAGYRAVAELWKQALVP